MLPVFVIDRALMAQGAASRWRLARALKAFDAELRYRLGQGVLVLRGEPEEVLPALAARQAARTIHASDWPCPAMRQAQDRLSSRLDGVALHLHPGHLLIHPAALRSTTGGTYRVYSAFARSLRNIGPDRPCPAPTLLTLASDRPAGEDVQTLDLAPDLYSGEAVLERHALPAGETAAWQALGDFIDRLAGYQAGRDRIDRHATSCLSEALALGEISPRSIWAAIQQSHAHSGDAQKFLSELIWREFAWHLLISFPAMAQRPWREEWAAFPWRNRDPAFEAWRQARTGIPLVDAGLREMRVTGRMHNRARMVCASYLTKHLLIDWRQGLAHFADSLTDWDPAANAMNWQWVAGCGPDAAPFFRIFNPLTQAKRFDPEARYQRRWLLGHLGSDSDAARDYFDTLPSDWIVPQCYDAKEAAEDLASGRRAALAAYEGMRV